MVNIQGFGSHCKVPKNSATDKSIPLICMHSPPNGETVHVYSQSSMENANHLLSGREAKLETPDMKRSCICCRGNIDPKLPKFQGKMVWIGGRGELYR